MKTSYKGKTRDRNRKEDRYLREPNPKWGRIKQDPEQESSSGESEVEDPNDLDTKDPSLDLDSNEINETDEETLPYAKEDWEDAEQIEVPKKLEPDLPFAIQTQQSDRTRLAKRYNPYGDDFAVDRIDLKKIVEELVGLEEILA